MIEIDWQFFGFLMFVHCLNGSIAALVAKQKGRNFNLWLVGGLIGGTAALFVAFWVSPLPQNSE